MSQRFRISLPGYDALTDTNPDHFGINADADNVLIKEFIRGGATLGANTSQTITHNLGYLPFFLAYVLDTSNSPNYWKLIPHYQSVFSVPPFAAMANTSSLTIQNNYSSTQFKWYIFYDNISGGGGTTFTPSHQALRVSRAGFDATTDTNPNNYIFHSDLNTFKILTEGNVNLSYTGANYYTFNHGASLTTPTSYVLYLKFPDGYTTIVPGSGTVYSYDNNWYAVNAYITTTQISVYISGNANATIPAKYYVFETPLS